jgi:hypothetical protein
MEVVEEKRENCLMFYCFKVIKNSRYGLVSSRGEFILPLIYGSLTRDYCYYYELYVTVRLNEHMIGLEIEFNDDFRTINECGEEKKQPKPVVRMQDLSADEQTAFRRRRDLFYGSIPLIYSKRINPPFWREFFWRVVAPMALFDSIDGGAVKGEQVTLQGLLYLWENTNGLFSGICGKCGGKTGVVHVTGDPASDAIKEKVSVCPQCGAITKESADGSFSAMIAERDKCKDETWHHHASPERLAAVIRGDVKFEAEVSDRWNYPVVSDGLFDEATFEPAFSGDLNIVKWDETELDLRKRLLNKQFVWTEEAKQGLLQLNRVLLKATKLAKTEGDRRFDLEEFIRTFPDKTFNYYSIPKKPKFKLKLAIEEKDKSNRWERCDYGVYGDLNRFLYTDGSINDSKVEKWETYPTAELPNLIGSAAAAHFAGIDTEWSFGLHALWHCTPLAWEDILKIRTVCIEAKYKFERVHEFKIFRQKKKNSSN